MAKRNVNIVVKARDEASRKFGIIGRSVNKMASSIKSAATMAAIGGAAALTAGFVITAKKSIQAASIAEETKSKFLAVFKEQSAAAEEFAAQLAQSVNRSKTILMGFMSTLQDTFVPLGYSREQARQMSEAVSKLAIDLASFNNKADGDVVRDLQSALVGNHETVRKYGVILTQATLNQELMNMGVKDGVKYATEQQKALARMNLILKGTTDAQGDAARTAGSFANQWKGLKADMFEGAAAIGGAVLPQISKFIEKIRESFTIAKVYATNWQLTLEMVVKKAALNIIGFVLDIKHWFTAALPSYLSWFRDNWKNVFVDIFNGTKAIITNLWTNFKNFFDAVWGWLKGGEWEFAWTPLLDGFKKTMEDLPQVAERSLSSVEKTLKSRVTDIGAELKKKIEIEVGTGSSAKDGKSAKNNGIQIDLTADAKNIIKKGVGSDKSPGGFTFESSHLKYAPGSQMNYQKQTADYTKAAKTSLAKLLDLQHDLIDEIKNLGGGSTGMTLLPAEL